MTRFGRYLASFALVLTGNQATATTTTTTAVLSGGPYGSIREPFYSGNTAERFDFNPGDTIDLTLSFPAAGTLALSFLPARLTLVLYSGLGILDNTYTTTSSFDFIGAVGPVRTSSGPVTESFTNFPTFQIDDFRLQHRGLLSFTGIHAVIHLDSVVANYPPGGGGVVPLQTFGGVEIGLLDDVPEPAVWLLLIAGFGAVGIAMRRRRATPIEAVGGS